MTTIHEGPRYTHYGSPRVERDIASIVARAAGLVEKHFRPQEYRALVLLGGYGRGEGGVLRENGIESAHNNIDFLLVTPLRMLVSKSMVKQRLDAALFPIVKEHGIGVDTGVISEFELRRTPARIMWCDLRWGHRTILGDASLIPSLEPLPPTNVEIDDVHHLLVNRASLLVINDAIVERELTSELHKRFVLKHQMKAIIGHGDALLFMLGRYHPSYFEKQRRMRDASHIVPGLAELYDMAAEFRFAPDYGKYLQGDLSSFIARSREVLARAHLEFERLRSGDECCTFANHIERVLYAKRIHPFAIGNVKNLLRQRKHLFARRSDDGLSQPIRRAVRWQHPRMILNATLPAVLYGSTDEQSRMVRTILDADDCSPRALRKAYLRHWAMVGDPNYRATAERLGLA